MKALRIPGRPHRLCVPDDYTLIVGGSPIEVPVSLLLALATNANDIIAADAGADKLKAAKQPIDALVGDFDSISREALEYAFACDPAIEKVPSEKDFTDIMLALRVAVQREASHVVLCGCTGGRLDHTLAIIGCCEDTPKLSPLIVDQGEILCFLSSEGPRSRVGLYDLSLRDGDEFSVVSLAKGSRVEIDAVHYLLHDHELGVLDGMGISNVVGSSQAQVTCVQGSAIVIIST